MKIWKASLSLFYNINDKYDINFRFELQKENYRINDCYHTEYIHSDGWVYNRIPIEMKIEDSSYNVVKIVQGFDHELTSEELNKLELNMRILMAKQLELEKELFLTKHLEKMKVVNS